MVTELTQENFSEKIGSGYAVIDFWAPWCGPCQKMGPVFEEVSGSFASALFAKVNVDENQDLAGQFGVMSIPTLLVFKDGAEVHRLTGYLEKEQLVGELTNVLK